MAALPVFLLVASHQLALSLAMLVDMCHLEVVEVEAHAQIAGAQHAVKVGYRRKLLGDESAIEGIESFYTFIFPLEVSLHESDVRGRGFRRKDGQMDGLTR